MPLVVGDFLCSLVLKLVTCMYACPVTHKLSNVMQRIETITANSIYIYIKSQTEMAVALGLFANSVIQTARFTMYYAVS